MGGVLRFVKTTVRPQPQSASLSKAKGRALGASSALRHSPFKALTSASAVAALPLRALLDL